MRHKNEDIIKLLKSNLKGEWKEGSRGFRIRNRLHLEYGERFDWPDPKAPEAPPDAEIFCHALRDHVGILCDGTVVPCCLDADGVMALGNLFTQPLRDIIGTDRAKAIYDGFTAHRAAEELCRRCGYARRFRKP